MKLDRPELVEVWRREQETLARKVKALPLKGLPRYVVGADCAFNDAQRRVIAAAVVWDRKADEVVDEQVVRRKLEVPYIPGFLSFREGPAVLEAIAKLSHPFDAAIFDGQGRAHPRRCGIATHLSVTLDIVGVGCAKSRFVGEHRDPDERRGKYVALKDGREVVGSVVRTRDGVRPVYVSVGHRINLAAARRLVLACCTRYRLPEPTRLADRLVARSK